MPVQACVDSRDSITQDLGRVLSNHYDYSDATHVVTSYARTSEGTWIAWKNLFAGEELDPGSTSISQRLALKATWPSEIASSYAVGVGYFPDDESAPVVYELGIEPIFTWDGQGLYAGRDICSLYPIIGDIYSDNSKSILTGWGIGIIDVQVRTDGSNVWVVALAREAVKYPFLYNNPSELDACGRPHPTLETDWAGGHSDPFIHDSDSGSRWWYYQTGQFGGNMPFGPYDDPGPNRSFRWQPARITVWAGDIGGFTALDTIEAKFQNDTLSSGLCSGIETAASETEPGVLHVLWSEGGSFGLQTVEPKYGERINYSRWDFMGKTLDTDLFYSEANGTSLPSDVWVFTAEIVLRNDHGSPVAIVWPPTTDGISRFASGAAEFWDLSSGTANVLQTADLALAPTSSEGNDGGFPETVIASLQASVTDQSLRRKQFASSLYTDPRLDNTDVYLLCIGYGQGTDRAGCRAFLRIPCDGSATFDYMDGTRLTNYSIIPGDSFHVFGGPSYFSADFVSDTQNVWMPININIGGAILHLTRICERTWEVLPAFPDNGIPTSGYELGQWGLEANVQPPTLLTDESGHDWIAGGGNGPVLTVQSTDPTNIAALRARICRCCVPCQQRVGLHVWDVI